MYKDRDLMTVDLMTVSHSISAQSLTHHCSILVFKQVTSFELRAAYCLESKPTFFEFSLVRSGCFMVWERLKTFVQCAFAHSDRSGNGASLGEQSQ